MYAHVQFTQVSLFIREKKIEKREAWRARLMKVFAARSNEEEDEGKVDRLVATASPRSAASRDSRFIGAIV